MTIQVLVAIDARPNIKIKAISHKQFVEFVGTHDVPGKPNIEQVRFKIQGAWILIFFPPWSMALWIFCSRMEHGFDF